MKKLIIQFLSTYCTEVLENESPAYVELMMDDHDCIEYESVQYYVPKNHFLFSEDDELLKELLIANYSL
jgi:hypothetical protein